MAGLCDMSPRAFVQIVLTGLALSTAITAFAFAFFFEQYMDQIYQNVKGEMVKNGDLEYLPCVRSTLDVCNNENTDSCSWACCPSGYECKRGPMVGLYCQGETVCGDMNWCLSFANIPETCPTDVCQAHQMVERATMWSYITSAVGIFIDLTDVITFIVLPDNIVFKSGLNVFSSLVKWIAFGSVVGADTQGFLTDLEAASCYNKDGVSLVASTSSVFLSYATLQVLSAILSLTLAPFSAYWGGKRVGVPYVK